MTPDEMARAVHAAIREAQDEETDTAAWDATSKVLDVMLKAVHALLDKRTCLH